MTKNTMNVNPTTEHAALYVYVLRGKNSRNACSVYSTHLDFGGFSKVWIRTPEALWEGYREGYSLYI